MNCYYCREELHYDNSLGLYVCNTKDCNGSAYVLSKMGKHNDL